MFKHSTAKGVQTMFKIVSNKWVIRKTIWPFPEGHGTFNSKSGIILDTGLTKEKAQKLCDELNRK